MSSSSMSLYSFFYDCILQIQGCLKKLDREFYTIRNISLQKPTQGARRTLFILRNRFDVFRDPAICSCFMTLATSCFVCVVLMEISTEKNPHLKIRSRIFFYETLEGSTTFMSTTLPWKLQKSQNKAVFITFFRISENFFF